MLFCSLFYSRVCENKWRNVCNPVTDTVCETVLKESCEVKYNTQCQDLVRDVPEEYYEDDCKEELKTVCDSRWVGEGRDKVWKEDPSTCRQLPQTDCQKVRKIRNKKEPYQVCNQVPYQDCKNIPEKVCRQVTREQCDRQSYEDCNDVQKQRCENVHSKTPQGQSESRPIIVCDDHTINNNPDVVQILDQFKSDDEIEIVDANLINNPHAGDGPRTGVLDSQEADEEEEDHALLFSD